LVATTDLKSVSVRSVGSSPTKGTIETHWIWIASANESASVGSMFENPFNAVLAILRLLTSTEGLTTANSVADHVRTWVGGEPSPSQVHRLYAYASDKITEARDYVDGSSLSAEARKGLMATLDALDKAFDVRLGSNAVNQFLPHPEIMITNFAILVSAAGLEPPPTPNEVFELHTEIEKLKIQLNGSDMDARVTTLAFRHLSVLQSVLSNIDALGVDAALLAYNELLLRLHRAEATASPDTREKLAKIWPIVEQWAGRLTIIEGALTRGQSLIEHASKMISLIPHFG
jgi:hypothetical protein